MIHCDNVSLTLWYIVIAICCWTDIDCEKSFARCMIHVYRCRDQSQEWYFGDISKGSTDISLNYRCNMLLIKLCDISLKFHWYITRAKRDIQRLLFALLFTNTVAFQTMWKCTLFLLFPKAIAIDLYIIYIIIFTADASKLSPYNWEKQIHSRIWKAEGVFRVL